jgi:hypothetical protein
MVKAEDFVGSLLLQDTTGRRFVGLTLAVPRPPVSFV